MITPLTKVKGDGALYTRPKEIEAHLHVLTALPRETLLQRAQICSDADSGYIPSECLVYFIRACRHDNDESWFEQLYKLLLARVYNSLPRVDDADGMTASFTQEAIRNEVVDRFVELIVEDRKSPDNKLDFFEIRFALGIKRMRQDAREKAWRDEKRKTTVEDEETGELSAVVETAAGVFDPREFDNIEDPLFRMRLDAAIDSLPVEQIRTLHMIRLGFPIDSKDPEVMTIAKALGTNEKTIRNYRDRAVASLQALFVDGDMK